MKPINIALTELKMFFKILGNKQCRVLRKLPWYILLGNANSGKTSLLMHADLDFSTSRMLGPDPLQSGFINSSHLWRICKEAVFIDVVLKKTSEDEQTSSSEINDPHFFWTSISKLIKRYRRRQPLNGVIITLNLPEILLQPDKLNHLYYQELKRAIQTIAQQLKTQLPIYIVFTQCDLIAGFREFFDTLTKEEREQVWGIAFPSESITSKQTTEYFSREYDNLIARLNESLLFRLEAERNSDKRQLMSYFPQQMQLGKKIIADFILHDSASQVRGIYFVSALQKGNPYDFMMSALATQYHLTLPALVQSESRAKTFFSKKLFHQIIFPEINWAENNRTGWLSALFFIVLGTIGLSVSYAKNDANLDTINRYLPEYQQAAIQLIPTATALTETLPLLNTLNAIQNIYKNDHAKWLLNFELYQPNKIENSIAKLFQQTLGTQFMPRVALQLESMLDQYPNTPELLYQTLKAYLVFNSSFQKNPGWIKAPLAYELSINLPDQPDEQKQILNYVDQSDHIPIYPIALNRPLIEKARACLRNVMPVDFVYYEMKQDAASSQRQLNLANKIGDDFNSLFIFQNKNIESVPGLFTLAGYENLRNDKGYSLNKHMAEIYYVLGVGSGENNHALISQMSPALWQHYDMDYINSWQRVLNNMWITPFVNLSQAIKVLNLITSSQSPLLKTLRLVKENTLPIQNKNLTIASTFSQLNSISDFSVKKSTQYKTMIKNLIALQDYLVTLKNASNTAQIEFQDASNYLQNKTPNNPIALLKTTAQQMPAPLCNWLDQIADNSFALLLEGAHQIISSAWQTTVMPSYQTTIQGLFPFNVKSNAFVSMTAFGNFFGNNSVLARFFKTYLVPFIDISHTPWQQVKIGAYSLGLSDDVVAKLEKAELIRKMYFPNADQNIAMRFSIKPRFLDSKSSSIDVQVDSQDLNYCHGPQQTINWHWPTQQGAQNVSISFNDFQGQTFSQTFDGPWAWFKLLNASQLKTTCTEGHYTWTVTQNKHQASFDLWATDNLPLFDLQILESFNLPERI